MPPQTYVAVDTEALAHNLKIARTRLHEKVRLMAVVKANGYGHGLELAASAFASAGADWLGVSSVEEGIRLREAGLDLPVLVFLPALGEDVENIVEHRLTGTIVSRDGLLPYVRATEKFARACDVHIYMDTGLGRLSSDDSLPDIIAAAEPYMRINITGVYTHFGPGNSGALLADFDTLRPGASGRAFGRIVKEAMARAATGRIALHCASSKLFLEAPDLHMDMVRLGTVLYGQKPAEVASDPMKLRKTFELRTHIVATHSLPAKTPLGYGGDFVTRRESRIATLPVGTVHGLGVAPLSLGRNLKFAAAQYIGYRQMKRGLSKRGPWAFINGQRVPIVGRISMDQCCIDITGVDAQVGDEVTIDTRRVTTNPLIPRLATPLNTSDAGD